jgi:hypothetical protein
MTMTQISTNWAFISKDPGTGAGYTVLAASADDVNFRPFIGRHVPGSPSSTVRGDAADAPPWVTFGSVAGPDRVLTSVSVTDQSTDRDGAGRKVWPQRLFVMRFDDLAAAGASYQTLWAAVESAQVGPDQSAALPLGVATQGTGELAAVIDRYGLPRLGTLAAALLEGPVTVADAAGLSRDERLALLDAVAALLPYGFRADLSASSVVDNTAKHGIRLVFADYAAPGQRLRSLRTPAPPDTGAGLHYLAMLTEKATDRGLQAVVDHLWAVRHACSFEFPGDAQAILAELDFYGGFRRAARAGRPPRDQVLKFFTEPVRAEEEWSAFDPAMRENVLFPYLADQDEEVLSAALRCWEFSRFDVAQHVNRLVGARGASFGLWCLRVAHALPADQAQPAVADQLLGKMLIPEGLPPGERDQRIVILVQLLRQRGVPSPRQLRYSCTELRFGDLTSWQSHLVRALLTEEAAAAGSGPAADRVVPWVRWLCQSPLAATQRRPLWVAALDFMLDVSAADHARAVILRDAPWAVALLRVSARFGRFPDLIVAASRQLLELAARRSGPAQQPDLADLLAELDRNLWALNVPPATIAEIDLVRVLLGGRPRDLAGPLTDTQLDSYGDSLSPLLTLDILALCRSAIEQAFLHHVASGAAGLDEAGVWLLNSWAADPDRLPALIDFIADLEPDVRPYHPNLSEDYWAALATRPELADYAAGQQLMIATRESVKTSRTAFRRRITGDGITSTPLARACLRARSAGLSPAGIVTALARGGAGQIEPPQLDEVLGEVRQLLAIHYAGAPGTTGRPLDLGPRRAADADLYEFLALIVWGALGELYGEDFRLYLAGRARHDIDAQRRLNRALRKARRKRGRVDQDRWVDSVVGAGLGTARPWWSLGRLLRAGRKQDDDAHRA